MKKIINFELIRLFVSFLVLGFVCADGAKRTVSQISYEFQSCLLFFFRRIRKLIEIMHPPIK